MARMRDETGHDVQVAETYRSQSRQNALFAQGRATPGPVVTWTQNSKHTQGRAVDLVLDGGTAGPTRTRRCSASRRRRTAHARRARSRTSRAAGESSATSRPDRERDDVRRRDRRSRVSTSLVPRTCRLTRQARRRCRDRSPARSVAPAAAGRASEPPRAGRARRRRVAHPRSAVASRRSRRRRRAPADASTGSRQPRRRSRRRSGARDTSPATQPERVATVQRRRERSQERRERSRKRRRSRRRRRTGRVRRWQTHAAASSPFRASSQHERRDRRQRSARPKSSPTREDAPARPLSQITMSVDAGNGTTDRIQLDAARLVAQRDDRRGGPARRARDERAQRRVGSRAVARRHRRRVARVRATATSAATVRGRVARIGSSDSSSQLAVRARRRSGSSSKTGSGRRTSAANNSAISAEERNAVITSQRRPRPDHRHGADGAAQPASAPGGALGKDQFLKLLIAQLQNQDPMNPMQGDQMASQLAQFSSLEQLQQINTTLTGQQTSSGTLLGAVQSSAAINTIGHTVVAIGNQVQVGGANGRRAVTANVRRRRDESHASHLQLQRNGSRHRRSLGAVGGGKQTFNLGKLTEGLRAGHLHVLDRRDGQQRRARSRCRPTPPRAVDGSELGAERPRAHRRRNHDSVRQRRPESSTDRRAVLGQTPRSSPSLFTLQEYQCFARSHPRSPAFAISKLEWT